jgi:hypothetical protein
VASTSSEDRGTFLQESRTALLIICAIKTRFDRALNHGEIPLRFRFQQLSARDFSRVDGERRIGADQGCIALYIWRQFRAR